MNTPTAQAESSAVPVHATADNGAPPAARGRLFSAPELACIIAIPAAWGILLLFHPLGDGDFSEIIDGNVGAWITVHLGMGIFVPLFAGVVYLLLRGANSTAATVSRIGLAVFAVIYAAWELVLGVGTGILANETNALPEAQQAVGRDLVDSYGENGVIMVLSVVGGVALAVGMIGAVVALRRAYGLGWAPLVLMLLATPLIAIHEPPFGPVGLGMFIVAALLFVRQQASAPARSVPPLDRPVSAGAA
jgi:hypothetical protein